MMGLHKCDRDEPLDYDKLDPGIREVVRWLNTLGYTTTDSGDGVSKTDMECALPFPHVVIWVEPYNTLMDNTQNLYSDLIDAGIDVSPCGEGVNIEATYDPGDNTAIILLSGLTDDILMPKLLVKGESNS